MRRISVLIVATLGTVAFFTTAGIASDKIRTITVDKSTISGCGANVQGCNWCNSQNCYAVGKCDSKGKCAVAVFDKVPGATGPKRATGSPLLTTPQSGLLSNSGTGATGTGKLGGGGAGHHISTTPTTNRQ